MDAPTLLIETLVESIETYGNTSLQVTKMKSLQMATKVISHLITLLIAILFISVSFIALSLGLALYLSEVFEKAYSGYFVVAGAYFIIGILYHYFISEWIKVPIQNVIISKMFQSN